VILSDTLLKRLRLYWRIYRPRPWLFPNSQSPDQPLSIDTAQRVFNVAKRHSGLQKVGGLHSLRHA
jgi:integrase/recombinase XerD